MRNNPFTLNNKVIVVTGASSGIGRQCAITLSQLGGKVMLLGRNIQRLEDTLKSLENQQLHKIFAFDLGEYDKVSAFIKEISGNEGMINGLINCAGISTTLPFNAVSPSKMDEFFKSNVIGGINLTKHVVSTSNFSKEGGSVVFMSSVMGVVGTKGKTLYSMTKGALVSVTKSMAIELAPRRIRVNSVSPGVVQTPMSKSAIYSRNEEALAKVTSQHPLGLGKPEDVANTCAFLMSDASSWITGTNIAVDGGYLAV